jgi:RNase P protein component
MKRFAAGTIVGLLVASAAWGTYAYFLKSKYALQYCAFYSGEPEHAHALFELADSSSPEKRAHARNVMAHIIKSWISLVDMTDDDYPFLNVKERLEEEYKKAEELLPQYEERISNQDSIDARP